ncbi:hypothetical protein [Dysgonomonas sp. HDW5B]|uniref:hypothetical protein n=1 Tax=Dysgonomonas sp. HDW5B TaxID=2714927 RepID=UPI00351ADFB8
MGIQSKELSKLGYTNNVARSLAINIVNKYCKHDSKEQIIKMLSDLLAYPDKYKDDEVWGKLAEHFSPTPVDKSFTVYSLLDEP